MNLSLSRTDSQKGIKWLETAIILIAFVVVTLASGHSDLPQIVVPVAMLVPDARFVA